MTDPKRIVADGYDRLGDAYCTWFDPTAGPVRSRLLSEISSNVPGGTDLLELGCGPGIDAMTLVEDRRYRGVDISDVMVGLARRRVPSGTFLRADLASVAFRPESFDAVVSLHV